MQGLAPDAALRAARSPAAFHRSRRNVAQHLLGGLLLRLPAEPPGVLLHQLDASSDQDAGQDEQCEPPHAALHARSSTRR